VVGLGVKTISELDQPESRPKSEGERFARVHALRILRFEETLRITLWPKEKSLFPLCAVSVFRRLPRAALTGREPSVSL